MNSKVTRDSSPHHEEFEYIVVGSGPGGGPVAANLARQGHKVLLLEAGDDQGQNLHAQIPAFFFNFEEDALERWDFFVKHYDDPEQAAKDPKMTWRTPDGGIFIGTSPPAGSKQLGIYYPRAGTLGGCAAHNGMVALLPPAADWDHISQLTGDKSWEYENVRPLFERLERNRYVPPGTLAHGFHGYIETNLGHDSTIEAAKPMIDSALAVQGPSDGLVTDVNPLFPEEKEGVYRMAMTMSKNGHRSSARDYLVATSNAKDAHGNKKYPLTIWTHSLATRVIFNGSHKDKSPRATGVEFLQGQSLYKADPRFNPKFAGVRKVVHASKEVVVAGGVFNSPQLLKLSGIGPKDELEKFGIEVVADLPGVGTNLQDNYEFGVIGKGPKSFSPLVKGTGLTAGDPLLREWIQSESGGPYASNTVGVGVFNKSSVAETHRPDTVMFGIPFKFTGFFPGFSTALGSAPNPWTWDVLKISTRNSKVGTVRLASKDPRDVPEVNFRYFDQGGAEDLKAMCEGVELARRIDDGVEGFSETVPGPDAETEGQVTQRIRDEAFSHHASCTVAIGGDDDAMACLDSKFRVRGVDGLRVVDASAFPRVPGSFPTLAIYILAEKATDFILADASKHGDDKILGGIHQLEVLEEDKHDNSIVFAQARQEY
ncbi:hypothetical protein diail_6142 [Diaporthe ilicicola]|nr:hypothetical protein diail_6142 [Diaporthe ilicicola]